MREKLKIKLPEIFSFNLSVAQKVFGIVSIVLFMLMVVSGFSIWQMNKIGDGITTISDRNLPLSRSLSKLSTLRLEQSINFQRLLRYGNLLKTEPIVIGKFEEIAKDFQNQNAQVTEELQKLSVQLSALLSDAKSSNEETLFISVFEKLASITSQQDEYFQNSIKAIDYLRKNNSFAVLMLIPKILKEQKVVDEATAELVTIFENFSIEAVSLAQADGNFATKLLIGLGLGALFFSLVVTSIFISRSISKPLAEIVRGLDAIAKEDTSVDVPVRSNDEIGAVARAYAKFKETLIASHAFREQQEEMKLQAEAEKKQTMLDIAQKFEDSIGHIVTIMASTSEELSATAGNITEIVEDTNGKASEVTSASELASNNVQSVATAAEEMSYSIQEINRQINDSAAITQNAVKDAKNTTEQMSSLAETAKRIEEVVSFISDIADQTNLLALNATIESARAGDAGKGFAVVAAEVKELAKDTTKATEDIVEHIKEIQEAISRSVLSVDQVGEAISSMNDASSNIASVMEQQGSATQEISKNVQEAAMGTDEVTKGIRVVSRSAEETGNSIASVANAAIELSKQTETLEAEVTRFLTGLRDGPADRRENEDPNYDGVDRRNQAGEIEELSETAAA